MHWFWTTYVRLFLFISSFSGRRQKKLLLITKTRTNDVTKLNRTELTRLSFWRTDQCASKASPLETLVDAYVNILT